jgi:hypothetical protein
MREAVEVRLPLEVDANVYSSISYIYGLAVFTVATL